MRSIRIWFTKKDASKYISHLDLTRCLIRAFRRTDIPLWYTEGFNPHPYLVFGLPLPLGVEGLREVLDIRLTDDSYPNERVLKELNRVSVPGIEFLEVAEPVEKNLAINKAKYTVSINNIYDSKKKYTDIKSEVEKGTITIEKKSKKGVVKEINICEHLIDFNCTFDGETINMSFILPAGNDFTINPISFCYTLFEKVGISEPLCRIVRQKLLTKDLKEFR